jgi:hypothetical protein
VIKRLRFPLDIMLLCVRWYVAYPLSLRNLEEMMQERGLFIDHSTIHRWIVKLVRLWCKVEICKPRSILKAFRLRRRAPHSRSPALSCLRLRACEARTALAECDVKAQRRQA